MLSRLPKSLASKNQKVTKVQKLDSGGVFLTKQASVRISND
jgi:hypothetical protein